MRRWIWLMVLVLAGCSGSAEPRTAASSRAVTSSAGSTTGADPGQVNAPPSGPLGSRPSAPSAAAPSGVASSNSPVSPAETATGDPADLMLAAGGVVRVNGRSSLSMSWQQARDAVSAVLGPPQRTTGVGEVCDTHVMPGFAITWKNFRVLVQSQPSDNEYLGNDRLGRIVGWEVWRPMGPKADDPTITPPLRVSGGVGLGSRLSAVRAAYPKGRLFQGDGDHLWHVGSDLSNDLSFHFTDDAASTRPYFIASGYACGS